MRKEKLEELKRYIEELKTIEIIKQNKLPSFINSEVYKCILNNGGVITREKIIKGKLNGNAVCILPITLDGEVILVVEPRVFTKRSVGIGLPAGYIESGEESKVAALRELQEETGYSSNNIVSLGGFYQDMGCSEAYIECFLALNCEKRSDQHLDKGEFVRYFKCSFDEFLELMDWGYIEDSHTIITLEKSKSLGGKYV